MYNSKYSGELSHCNFSDLQGPNCRRVGLFASLGKGLFEPATVGEPIGLLSQTPETHSLHIRERAFPAFGDESVNPRGDNGQLHRAELEHRVVESADVEFRSERLFRFFASTALRLTQPPLHRFATPMHLSQLQAGHTANIF